MNPNNNIEEQEELIRNVALDMYMGEFSSAMDFWISNVNDTVLAGADTVRTCYYHPSLDTCPWRCPTPQTVSAMMTFVSAMVKYPDVLARVQMETG